MTQDETGAGTVVRRVIRTGWRIPQPAFVDKADAVLEAGASVTP
ncbi:hypothetical protein [Streptomyces atratus]